MAKDWHKSRSGLYWGIGIAGLVGAMIVIPQVYNSAEKARERVVNPATVEERVLEEPVVREEPQLGVAEYDTLSYTIGRGGSLEAVAGVLNRRGYTDITAQMLKQYNPGLEMGTSYGPGTEIKYPVKK